jgi:integrating conjugative element protein (TIGR03752 family)
MTSAANVAAMTAEVKALRQGNVQMRNENRQLLANRAQIEENVTTRVKRALLSRQHDQQAGQRLDTGELSSLNNRVEALSRSLADMRSRGEEIPIGMGLAAVAPDFSVSSELTWIDPLEVTAGQPVPSGPLAAGGLLQRARDSSRALLATDRERSGEVAGELNRPIDALRLQPVYTVPRNATLIGSTTLTALVGRIPVQGQVRDPMPFKVITGADNLAANGLRVPGIQGMVWSGTAVGDWTLSCVTGRLDSVTFVFDDGTIQTISSDDRNGNSRRGDEPLGWISDDQGIPCVSGERKTNAPAFLSQRIGIMAVQAAAEAAAAAQTTTLVNNAGAGNSVTGNTGTYVLGKTLSGGSDEVGRWLQERQSQSFDAVFVSAGTRVTLHIDRAIPIDFDSIGRRLSHASPRDPHRSTHLD